MTTSGTRLAAGRVLRHRRWQALLLPLLAVGICDLFPGSLSWLAVFLAVAMAVLIPRFTAGLAPFAVLAYGAYGLFLARGLAVVTEARVRFPVLGGGEIVSVASRWGLPTFGVHRQTVRYGVLQVGPTVHAIYVLPQAIAILVIGTWLLVATDAPGSGAVRQALAQLRGADGELKTAPPLLLLPVMLLWEELLSQRIWFDDWSPNVAGRVYSVAILAVGVAVVTWLPRVAAAAAVLGTAVLGFAGMLMSLRLALPAVGPANWFSIAFYGPLTLYGRYSGSPLTSDGRLASGMFGDMLRIAGQGNTLELLLTAAQGIALLVVGGLLATRLPTRIGDDELAGQARALTQRVTRLTETRKDATEAAVAELRRIERDLHDGAQARLVAVGMSLRAAERLMPVNPEAAMALVTEARETSSRALDDLRDLVRGIYPPVLADRGLSDAVRALALDAPLTVDTDITLAEEPPVPVAAAVYFAIAEALTNAVRHSGGETAQIGIGYADGMLRAVVTDDGQGGADPAAGTGLSGVERRLATFDGILAVTSPPGGPTIIAIEVPCLPAPAYGTGWAGVVRSSWQTRTLI